MPKTVILSAPPYQVAPISPNGLLSDAWQKWIQQLFLRVGGISAISNISLTNVETTKPIVSTLLTGANKSVYTSPPGLSTVIDSMTITNADFSARTLSIYILPFDTSPSDVFTITSKLSILPGATISIQPAISQVLGSGASIVTTVDKDNVVSMATSGRQVS